MTDYKENAKHMIGGIETEAKQKVENLKKKKVVVGMIIAFAAIVAIAGVATLAL